MDWEKKCLSSRDRGKNRGGGGGGGDRKRPFKAKERFKGEKVSMNGNVFQCNSEQTVRGEFEETMGALKTFTSTKYVVYIDYLTLIFVDIQEPTLSKPMLSSAMETIELVDGMTRKVINSSTEELQEFKMKLKEFLKDEKAVKAIKRSLYNVVWGQCSHMLRTKLRGDNDLKK